MEDPRKSPIDDVPAESNRPDVAPFQGTVPEESSPDNNSTEPPIFVPTPNPVGELNQPSYHFRLFLASEMTADNEVNPPSVVIAETGATALNITNVQIEALVGPNIRTRNAMGTSVTITIVEPYGARLPDVLFNAASRMKILNYTKAPWTLDLRILGYDASYNPVVLEDRTWRWRLLFLNIESKISETGAEHTIQAIPLAEQALQNQYSVLANAVAVVGETVGEVLEKTIQQMNREAADRYGNGFLEYAIEDRPYVEGSAITSPFQHRIVSETPHYHDERNQGRGQYSPGTDIPSIVDALMASTETAVDQARLSRSLGTTTNGEDPEATDLKYPNSIMHRIETKVEYTGYYNELFGDYSRKITFIVKPYDTVRLMTSLGNAEKFMTSKQLQVRKVRHALKNNFLSKVYEYIFTGLNTEVEKFDIGINFNWAVAVPLLRGRTHYGSSSIPRAIDNQKWDIVGERIAIAYEQLAIADRLAEQADSDRLREQNAETRERVEEIERGAIVQQAAERQVSIADLANSRRVGPAFNTFSEQDIEELGNEKVKLALPLTIMQDGDNPSISAEFGSASQTHEGRSIYGSLLNQMYGAFDGNLQNIELTIRGDPYWLGPGITGEYETPSSSSIPNFQNGEHMFIFRFKFPLGVDIKTASTELEDSSDGNTSDVYSGFYSTIRCVHSFNEGKFTQTLTGVRILGWQIDEVVRLSDYR